MSNLRAVLAFSIFSIGYGNPTLINLPANSWYQAPNSHLYDVRPSGWSANVMDPWCGGAYDTKRDRLIIWGGGHNDYNGNELYAFDIATLKWIRLTDPSPNPSNCGEANGDGTPNSRHTYSGLDYIAHADRFFGSGGAIACNAGGCGTNRTWTFDFDSETWTNRNPTGTRPPTGCGNSCAYDPVSKKLFWGENLYISPGRGLYSYDYDANQWTKYDGEEYYYITAAVDPKRRLLFFIGNDDVIVYDISKATPTRQVWTTTGGSGIVGQSNIGLAYDPVSDKMVAWNGGAVYALNADTRAWTVYSATGAPARAQNGTYGRWRYVPSVNAFVNVNRIDQNVYFYKLTSGAGTSVQSGISSAMKDAGLSAAPNPFRGAVRLTARVAPGARPLTVKIYDCAGKRVGLVTAARRSDGLAECSWSPGALSQGMYLAETEIGGRRLTKPLMFLK